MNRLLEEITTGDWRIDGIFFMVLGLILFGYGCYWFLRLKDWWLGK